MLSGDLPGTAARALEHGAGALERVGLTVGTAIEPMLASTATSVVDGVEAFGTASVEWKLDGARVQVHRAGDDVRVFTRNLNDITARSPEVVDAVAQLACERLVLDGEVLGLDADGRPRAFQDTMARFGADDTSADHRVQLTPVFFDILHLDGVDVIDETLDQRHRRLDALLPERLRVPRLRTDDPAAASQFFDATVDHGHEGVMVKDVTSTYEAGRRGKGWLKVKPVHTYDLVVLAAEWGHGRREGWLSNLHLGARHGAEFVMVGKTFKGLTDELLAWQTERLQELATRRTDHVVWVRPELVVEIALDGVQRSTRYPGELALRFARVKQYRPDKAPDAADTLDSLRRLLR
jgi:DNA ligase-1